MTDTEGQRRIDDATMDLLLQAVDAIENFNDERAARLWAQIEWLHAQRDDASPARPPMKHGRG